MRVLILFTPIVLALIGTLPARAAQPTLTVKFAAEIPLKLIARGASGGAVAWLAVEDPAHPWPRLPHRATSAGPFYLVWENPRLSDIGGAGVSGPDLGRPMNVTQYLTEVGLRSIIRDPRAVLASLNTCCNIRRVRFRALVPSYGRVCARRALLHEEQSQPPAGPPRSPRPAGT
jgi:hypothetical protein